MKRPPATREALLKAIRAAIKKAGGRPITKSEFLATSGMKVRDYYIHFPTWAEALRAAGLQVEEYNRRPADSALLEDWAAVVRRLQRPPTGAEYRIHGKYGISTLDRRFHGWRRIPDAFRSLARKHPEWKDVLDLIPPPSPATLQRRARLARACNPAVPRHIARKFSPIPNGRHVRGEPLGFGPMRNAPLNEMGVIGVFTLLASRLGFQIESLHPSFPDCEASRRVGPAAWQSVRIEFEYESRKFRDHGHPPDGCDIIVCWIHNWAECPKHLEVIELSEEVKRFAPDTAVQ